MKTRISHLHKKEYDWNKLAMWSPEAGELVIYDPDETYTYARLKIGDGKTPLKDLPFVIEAVANSISAGTGFKILDAGRITDYTK